MVKGQNIPLPIVKLLMHHCLNLGSTPEFAHENLIIDDNITLKHIKSCGQNIKA